MVYVSNRFINFSETSFLFWNAAKSQHWDNLHSFETMLLLLLSMLFEEKPFDDWLLFMVYLNKLYKDSTWLFALI